MMRTFITKLYQFWTLESVKAQTFSPLNSIYQSHIIYYPTSTSLNYLWSFGFLACVSLVIQIISGIFIAMYYKANVNVSLESIEFLMREVKGGWLARYTHANGASMFFIVVYCHIFRGLYYNSYIKPRIMLWCSGVVLFILMMATAFTGYVLPWGQMSFWAATVITNLVTVLPMGSQTILEWLWGGYVIKNPTLHRFFVIHFFLPFLIVGITFIHLTLLHRVGSNSPIGSDNNIDNISFSPYFLSKDVIILWIYLFIFIILVLYYSNRLNHSINYIAADPFKTPKQIIPEWYFLAFFSVLRSIPHKTGGITPMGLSIIIFLLLPFLNTAKTRNSTNRPFFRICLFIIVFGFLILIFMGTHDGKKDIVIYYTQIYTTLFFIFFLLYFLYLEF